MNRDALLLGGGLLVGAAALFLFSNNAQAEETASTGSSGVNGFAVNNPGNLRYIAGSNAFNGQIGQTANGIGKYDTLQNGCRAMYLQLREYCDKDGLTTITKIVTTYAPPSENDTAAYIASVSKQTGIDPDATLNWNADGLPLQFAMIVQEQGQDEVDANNFSETELQTLLQNAGVL